MHYIDKRGVILKNIESNTFHHKDFVYTWALKSDEIDVQKILSSDNVVDLHKVIVNLNIPKVNTQDWNAPTQGYQHEGEYFMKEC